MKTRAGVGTSKEANSFEAGASAAREALTAAGSSSPVVAIVYATVFYDQRELLRGVRSILPDVPLVGSSTQGISYHQMSEEIERIVGVAVICSQRLQIHTAHTTGISKAPEAAGRHIAQSLHKGGKNPILVWYDPITGVDIEAFLQGMSQEGFPLVIGGGAGQPFGAIHKTYQYFNESVHHDAAIALQLEGCEFFFDLTNGVEPLGLELNITKTQGNIILEIDGQPALDVWTEQFGAGDKPDVSLLASWALGVQLPPELALMYEGPITKAIFGFNEDPQGLILQAPIESGTTVQLCHRTPEAVYQRALSMARRLQQTSTATPPFLHLSFECAARPAPFLGAELANREVQDMQKILGEKVPWLGFYAWGELAPVGRKSFFHNYTFPLCVLRDSPEAR